MELLHLLHKGIHVKGYLGKEQHVRSLAVLSLCQGSSPCQPARVPAHDLQDGHVLLVIYKAVPDNLFCNSADILGRASVSRGMVRGCQVIVNGLGHAHEANLTAV